MYVLEVKGVSKSFGDNSILENIKLKLKEKEILGIVGASGQGKSVLIKTLIGFLKPDKGEIISPIPKNKVGFSMQDNSIYEYLKIKQNWKYFGKLKGLSRTEIKEQTQKLLEELDLTKYRKKLVKKLSGGTQKRVDLGCALITKPKILILDEPFLGLDPELIRNLSKYLTHLKKQGTSIIISSHRVKEISLICSRLVQLKNKTISPISKRRVGEVYR